jgi:hypothetical protein
MMHLIFIFENWLKFEITNIKKRKKKIDWIVYWPLPLISQEKFGIFNVIIFRKHIFFFLISTTHFDVRANVSWITDLTVVFILLMTFRAGGWWCCCFFEFQLHNTHVKNIKIIQLIFYIRQDLIIIFCIVEFMFLPFQI